MCHNINMVVQFVEQLSLPTAHKKRVRYKIPTYKKADKINQNILEYSANQKHIFRYKALQQIYEEIAYFVYNGQMRLPVGDLKLFKDGIIIYFDIEYGIYNFNYQAEIDGTQNLPVGERLRIHIRLLRLLRQGYNVKKAVRLCKRPLK